MDLNTLSQSRFLHIYAFVAGCLGMAYAYYLQFYDGLEPCPLCIFDRVFLLGIVFTALIAAIHNPQSESRLGQKVYSLLGLGFVLAGLSSSGRHVWLQHLPADQVPECGPGLNYMLDVFPVFEMIEMVFRGSGECADIDWQFFGISLPEATLMIFIVYAVYAAIQFFRKDDKILFPFLDAKS